MKAFGLLLLVGVLAAAEQPVLLPLPDLLRSLDAKQEWLMLPLPEYDRLVAAGRDPAPSPTGAEAFLASATVTAQVVDGREIALTAEFSAINRGDGPALADLFATTPVRLGSVRLGGGPAVLAAGAPLRLLLPRPGRFVGSVQWTVPLAGDIQKRSANLPLPLAGGLSLRLDGDGRGTAIAAGLARDGAGWRLVAPLAGSLDLAWLPGGGGDDAPVFGAEQAVAVQVQAGPRPLRWTVRLEASRGAPPQTLDVILPPGFTCTAAQAGVARLTPTAEGIEITRSAGTQVFTIDGLLAAGAAVALPRISGAVWQGGTVKLISGTALACEPPAGWRPLGGQADDRAYAVSAPDAGMVVEPLAADAGLGIATSTAVAVGPQRALLEQVLTVRAGGTRLFRLPLRLPAGWRPTALRGKGVTVPPADDLAPGSTIALDLPLGLAPGAELTLLFTAEAGVIPPPALPLLVPDAVRASHRLLLAAAPGIELGIDGPQWRLIQEDGAPAGVRAELRSDGEAQAVMLTAAPRAAAVDVDAVGWLLPAADSTWARFDLRIAVRDGELARLELDLPLLHDADLRLTGDGLTLAGDGPYTISAPKPWRGERLLRIEGRLRPEPSGGGKLPLVGARMPDASRQPVLRRWIALQAPGDRDVQLAAQAAARPIDADELPAWAQAIPGANVLAAWRLGEGEAGGWRSADRALAPLPSGFVDDLQLASQISPETVRTRLAFRLAAAGLAELDLGLPGDAILEQAAIDGAPAAVRRDGQRLLLALPGRTLVQVVLRYAGPGHARIALPGLAGLPVTRCTWTVAVDPSLRAQSLHDPLLMPLGARSATARRPWLGSWLPGDSASETVGRVEPAPIQKQQVEQRALLPPPTPERPVSEPVITLHGQLFGGTRSGAPQAAAFTLTPLAELRRADAIGRILAVLLGLVAILASAAATRALLALAVAAVPLSAALLAWQVGAGPLLALCEWLPFAVAVGLLARRLPLRAAVPVLLVAASLSSGEEPVRLMGYERLDAHGVPQGVVVALPRARFDELWTRAHGPAQPQQPLGAVAVAIGPPVIGLSLVGDAIEGRMDLPVMVPGTAWQELRLPLPGALLAVEALPLDATTAPLPRRITWKAEGGQLVLALEGGQQALVRLAFTLPTSEAAGGRRATFAVMPGLGGRLQLTAPKPWRAMAGNLVLGDNAADLPTAGGNVEIGWDLPAEVAPVDSRLSAEQRVALRLLPGRVAWTAELDLASAGVPLGSVRLVPPPGLVLVEVAGDGVAGWRRDGGVVVVTWAEPALSRRLHLAGVVARGGAGGKMAVALAIPGAAVSRGRLGLASAERERFLRPEHAALASAQPAEGEALAVRWDDQPEGLTVAWEEAPRELTVQRDVAVVIGEGRARAVAVLALSGRGASDSLRLLVPAPWRVAAVDGAVKWAVNASELVLAGEAPWAAGASLTVRVEADRSELGAAPPLPLFAPRGPGVVAGRLRLAVADAGATRAHLDAGEARAIPPDQVVQELTRSGGLALAAGERWRTAAESTGTSQPLLRLSTDEAQATAMLSHYLILGRDGVRWSLHLAATPEQGALPALALRLPAGARLVTVSGLGLGRWTVEGQLLRLSWAAPTAAAVAVDLELDVPAAADGSVQLSAPVVEGLRSAQQIVLVEEDDLGLVRRRPDGLGELEQPIARLPDGVDRTQVRWLWKAQRADWSLALTREPLAATVGADGLATLVDGAVTVAPDGELRGVATWHVVNRTRQQLPVLLPDGVELWEARVDGQAVRVRRDDGGALWLPVPPLRPGQASTRVGLVWRTRPQAGGRLRFAPPALGELKLIASTWRLSAPAGWTLARSGGLLQEADPADAAADRAQAVIEEIQRLQAVDGLNEAGLKRLEGQLAVLDSELKDHLASLGRRASALRAAAKPSSSFGISKIDSTTQAISDNFQHLGELQKGISGLYGSRAGRRKQLNIDALNQSWNGQELTQQDTQQLRRPLDASQRLIPAAWPWDEALTPAVAGGLGVGQAPPGLVNSTGATLTGIELVDESTGDALVLRGQGAALDAELLLTPPRQPLLPWLWLALSAIVLAVAVVVMRRRA